MEIVPIHAGIPHNVYVAAPHVSKNSKTCSDICVTYMLFNKVMLRITPHAPKNLI
jgi:hypothetical protein